MGTHGAHSEQREPSAAGGPRPYKCKPLIREIPGRSGCGGDCICAQSYYTSVQLTKRQKLSFSPPPPSRRFNLPNARDLSLVHPYSVGPTYQTTPHPPLHHPFYSSAPHTYSTTYVLHHIRTPSHTYYHIRTPPHTRTLPLSSSLLHKEPLNATVLHPSCTCFLL